MKIKSDDLIPIENNFKVCAGPGAGKTYWLINHIKNILCNSKRLQKNRKIACITYTNVAVKTINERLGSYSKQVEVSTIHSFLYFNVLKPYVYSIANEYGLNFREIDGHQDMKVEGGKIRKWIKDHPRKNYFKSPILSEKQLLNLQPNRKAINNWIKTLRYKFNEKELILFCDNSKAVYKADDGEETRINKDTLDLLSSGLFEYKKLYWQEGIIDHEDVLFFSYQLLKRYPFMLKILNAKYPYFFIDEFQDTNPIQVKIINMIAQEETVVGVIGDSAQSIYGFQGANCEQFESFELMNMNNYEIHGNRRSTNRIIDVLNSMRRDFKQKYIRNKEGEKPVIVIGDKIKAINKYNNEKLVTLSRKNITVNKIRKDIESTIFENDFLERFKEADSDKERRYTIMDTIFAIETAKNGNFREALKILDRISFLEKNKKNKFHYLKSLLDDYDKYSNDFLIDLYTYINDVLNVKLTTLRKNSKIRYFYKNSKYKEFVICVNSINEKSDNKTIHQSKGDEFDNIMIIKEDDNLDFLTNPDLINNEEHRIYYVAMSRAKEKLFINIPYLNNPKSLKNLEDLFEFIYLE